MVRILETFSQSKKIRSALECHTEEKAVGGDERGFSPVFVLVLPNITFNQQEKLEAVLSKIIWVFIATSNLNHNVWGPGLPQTAQRQSKNTGSNKRKEGIMK